MDLREIVFAQFPAFFLLSVLFLIAHLRVRKRSAVRSVLWVLLFGAALAVSILFCFLGLQAKYWTLKTLFELKFWSWLGIGIVALLLVLRLVFRLQNKHAKHMVARERTKAEREREQAVAQAREEGRAEVLAENAARAEQNAAADTQGEPAKPDTAGADAEPDALQ